MLFGWLANITSIKVLLEGVIRVDSEISCFKLFLAKRGRRPRVAGFIILSLKGLRRDEISCGVYGHIYLFIYL